MNWKLHSQLSEKGMVFISFNATTFLPVAGLADVAEYTARKIIEIVKMEGS
ncbi:MAG: hypothetical protein AB1502_10005 [Thermodesulfobacteriota bacterium]